MPNPRSKGFIQLPLIILTAVFGVVAIGGGGYVVVNKLAELKAEEVRRVEQARLEREGEKQEEEQLRSKFASTTAELESLKKEVAFIKEKEAAAQKQASLTKAKLTNDKIVKRLKPAVVYIKTANGAGSGMIFDTAGYILTNAHVVGDLFSVVVNLSDGRSFTAAVVGKDEKVDLAVLKVGVNNLSKVNFGDSDLILQGDEVFTLGYPFGLKGDVSFKEGTISRKLDGDGRSFLETSADIHPGNSGGPLVNRYGEVVGVNTAILPEASIYGIALGESIKLAIPINEAKSIIPDLKEGRVVLLPRDNTDVGTGEQNGTEESAPIQPKKYTEEQRKIYAAYLSRLVKIHRDLIAVSDLMSKAYSYSSVQNYYDALRNAGDAFAISNSIYEDVKGLREFETSELPYHVTQKEFHDFLLTHAAAYMEYTSAGKALYNARLNGSSTYGLVMAFNDQVDRVNSSRQKYDSMKNSLLGAYEEYFK